MNTNQATTRDVILTAGQSVEIRMTGTFLRCLSGAQVTVEIGSRTVPYSGGFPMAAGASVTVPYEFETVRLTSATSQTVRFFAFNGDYRDDTLIAGEDFAVNTKPLGYTMTTLAPVVVAAGTCVLIGAANSLRRYLGVYNEGVESVYVRENNTTAKSPFAVGSEAFLPVPLTSAVYCYNPSVYGANILLAEFV